MTKTKKVKMKIWDLFKGLKMTRMKIMTMIFKKLTRTWKKNKIRPLEQQEE